MEASEFSKRMKIEYNYVYVFALLSTESSCNLSCQLFRAPDAFPFICTSSGDFLGLFVKSHHLAVCTAYVTPEGCKYLLLLPGQQCSLQLLWTVKQQQHRQSVNSLSWLPVSVPDLACASVQSCWCTWGFAEPETPPSTSHALPSTNKAVTHFGITSFLQQTYMPDDRRSLFPKRPDAALLATVAGGENSLCCSPFGL